MQGKKILITGATGGIGKEVSKLCAKRGAKLILLARDEIKLQDLLRDLPGEEHKYYVFDLEGTEKIEKLVKQIVEEQGTFDGFVHAAGISSLVPLKMLKCSKLEYVMKVNFYSFVELVRCLVKKRAYKEGTSVVAISSMSSPMGDVAKVAYSASKASLDAAVRCMARELSPNGIRVNSVIPAAVQTGMYEKFLESNGETERMDQVVQRQYQGPSNARDIAKTILFLLSEDSKVITGTNMDVSGGFLTSR